MGPRIACLHTDWNVPAEKETLMMQTEGRGIWGSKGLEQLKAHRDQCACAGTDQSSEARSCLVLDLEEDRLQMEGLGVSLSRDRKEGSWAGGRQSWQRNRRGPD